MNTPVITANSKFGYGRKDWISAHFCPSAGWGDKNSSQRQYPMELIHRAFFMSSSLVYKHADGLLLP